MTMPMKKKIFSVLLILIFTFSFAIATFASTTTRLAGSDRYATAVEIAKAGWTESYYAVLVRGDDFPDALVATPLTKFIDAPILLTEKDNLTEVTKNELVDLKVKKVWIVGGYSVVSQNIENILTSMGIEIARFAGKDRYDTSMYIATDMFSSSTELIVTTGEDFPDALSIAPIAVKKGIPIILASQNYVSDQIYDYLKKNKVNKTYIIGGTDIISDNVANQFPFPERITGTTKYDRNIAILNKFNSDLTGTNVYIATGNDFADALAGSALAAKTNSPIVLVDQYIPEVTRNYLNSKLQTNQLNILGGESAVKGSLFDDLSSATPTPIQDNIPSSFNTPTSLNTTETVYTSNSSEYFAKSEITVKQIIRGIQAWDMIKTANMFNDSPKDGYEYLLAKIDFKLLDIVDGKALNLDGYTDFRLVSQDGKVYDRCSVVEPEPKLDASLYKGASNLGWVTFLVKTNDIKPVIVFGVSNDGTGGIWFKAYDESSSSYTVIPTVTPVISPTIPSITTPSTPTTTPVPAPVPATPIPLITNLSELKTFLNTNYSTLQTCIGQTHFTFNIDENTDSFTEYDYWIQVGYEYEFFSGAMTSIKYTNEQKNQLRNELEAHQENLAKAVIAAMPNKKFYGGYYDSWYKYPNLRLDLQTRQYYSWENYDDVTYEVDLNDRYNAAKPSIFRWWSLIDDEL